jgi:hypothetical protein
MCEVEISWEEDGAVTVLSGRLWQERQGSNVSPWQERHSHMNFTDAEHSAPVRKCF